MYVIELVLDSGKEVLFNCGNYDLNVDNRDIVCYKDENKTEFQCAYAWTGVKIESR